MEISEGTQVVLLHELTGIVGGDVAEVSSVTHLTFKANGYSFSVSTGKGRGEYNPYSKAVEATPERLKNIEYAAAAKRLLHFSAIHELSENQILKIGKIILEDSNA